MLFLDVSLCIIQSNAEAAPWSESTPVTALMRTVVLRRTLGQYAMRGFMTHAISLLCPLKLQPWTTRHAYGRVCVFSWHLRAVSPCRDYEGIRWTATTYLSKDCNLKGRRLGQSRQGNNGCCGSKTLGPGDLWSWF